MSQFVTCHSKTGHALFFDSRITKVVERYEQYKEEGDVLGYLKAVGNNIAGNIVA